MDLHLHVLILILLTELSPCMGEVCSYSYVSSYTTLYGTRYRTAYSYLYCQDACCGFSEKFCCQNNNFNSQTSNSSFGEFVGVALGGLTGAILMIVICLACCVALRKGKTNHPQNVRHNGQPVYTLNSDTGIPDLSDNRTFTLGQHGRSMAGQLQSGYMIDLSLPPPAYEHVVPRPSIPQTENNTTRVTTSNNASANTEPIESFQGETDADCIPRYQSVMRKGQWRNKIWTSTETLEDPQSTETITYQSTETLANQSSETLDSFVMEDGNNEISSLGDGHFPVETRISDTTEEYVTHL